jgi:hypothetical protein
MRPGVWLAAVLVLASCGAEVDTPAEPAQSAAGENRAPLVADAQIDPANPIVGDELRLASSVSDPEGDPVSVRIQWFVNRQLQDATGDSFATDGLLRGDEIYAVVRASDGTREGVGQSTRVLLGNSPPRVTGLAIRPERPDGSQTLVAEPTVQDPDGDAYEVHFEWLVNGQPVAGVTAATLEPGHVKRGDKLLVRARASDADPGAVFESQPIDIANARPQITSEPKTGLASEDRYEYQITAKDPDGDRSLRYSLVTGPAGMDVDLLSGLVTWTVPQDADGKFEIEVAVRDPHGAEGRQSYSVEFHWEKVEDKKSKPAKPATSDDY